MSKNNLKNYIGFVNDHSGSMSSLTSAAIKDYNTNINAVKDAATKEMLDTVVSVVGVGYPYGRAVTRQVTISNPHVLKPLKEWATNGGTPLYDGIGNMIDLLSNLPDAEQKGISFLVMITTDGEEAHSIHHTATSISNMIKAKQAMGNWTFVFRVPKSGVNKISNLGVPLDNIQAWDTTSDGLAASTQATTQAMSDYFTLRTAGKSSSSSFYTNTSQVNVAALEDITKEVSLYVVPDIDNGILIQPFILRHRQEYLKGAAFYQLTKTEARVQPNKKIVIRDRTTGKMFGGDAARDMLGLSRHQNVRLHPGDHGNFDVFIQSESINRKLVGGTGVVYWKSMGVPYTQMELDFLTERNAPKPVKPAVPPVVVLPKVTPTNKPTKSPIPVTPRFTYYDSRDEGRIIAKSLGKVLEDAGKGSPKGRRWFTR